MPTDNTMMSIKAMTEIPIKFLARLTFTVPVPLYFFSRCLYGSLPL